MIDYINDKSTDVDKAWFAKLVAKVNLPKDKAIIRDKVSISLMYTPIVNFDYLKISSINNATVFVMLFSDNIRILQNSSDIYVWDENIKLWEKKDKKGFKYYVIDKLKTDVFCKIIRNELIFLIDKYPTAKDVEVFKKDLKDIEKIINKYNNATFVNGIMYNVYNFLKSYKFEGSFDSSIDEIAINGGLVLNLRTLKSRERTRKDYFTTYMNFSWDKTTEGQIFIDSFKLRPQVRKFFSDICLKDKKMVKFLQYILGSCLTNDVKHGPFFVFLGSGANGKSLLMYLMNKILDTAYFAVDDSIIINNPKKSVSGNIDILNGKKMVVYPIFRENGSVNEGKNKPLTKKDIILVKDLFDKPVKFTPTFKFIILSNSFKKNSLSSFVLDQTIIFPFDARFVHKPKNDNEFERNEDIKNILSTTENLHSLGLWLIIGAYRSLNEKMKIPKRCKDVMYDYIDKFK
jgi:hypothetical protein